MKYVRKSVLILVATMGLLAGSSAVQAQPLANGGFETGDLTGWDVVIEASVGAPGVGAQEGSFALLLSGPDGSPPDPLVLQAFPASPGDEFKLSGYMLTESLLPGGPVFGLLKIVFQDAAGNDLEPASVTIGQFGAPAFPGAEALPFLNSGSAVNTWVFTETQAVAPANTAGILFLAINVSADGQEHPMWFDSLRATQAIACCFPNGMCEDLTAEDCIADGGTPQGNDTDCAGSAGTCINLAAAAIPTVTEWGLIVLALLMLTAGTIIIRREMVLRAA